MNKPQVTVIMSTYNDEKYISRAISSVITQSFKNLEFIILSDASSDKTDSIIAKYRKKDKRIRSYKNSIRKGITSNIKTLIELSKADLIARIDGDDFWLNENKLQEQYNLFNNDRNLGMVGTWAKVIGKNNEKLYELKYSTSDKEIRRKILFENSFITSSVMFRKPSHEDINSINLLNKYADDYNLWLLIGIKSTFANIPKIHTAYRVNPQGISQSKYYEQINDTIKTIKYYKAYYTQYRKAILLWTIRKYYPSWIKGKLSAKIKGMFRRK